MGSISDRAPPVEDIQPRSSPRKDWEETIESQ